MKLRDNLMIVDVETSGLNPVSNDLLEVALVMVNTDLEVIGTAHQVVAPAFNSIGWQVTAHEMHTKSGLMQELYKSERPIETTGVLDMITDLSPLRLVVDLPHLPSWMLAARSPGAVDVPFLRKSLPRLYGWLTQHTHKVFDFATLDAVHRIEDFDWQGTDHRALDDALNEARWLKAWMGRFS